MNPYLKMTVAVLTAVMAVCMTAAPSCAAEECCGDTGGPIEDIRDGLGNLILAGMLLDWNYGNTLLDLIGYGKQSAPSLGSSDEVKNFAREISMSDTASAITLFTGTVSTLVDNNTQTWSLAQSHMNRAAEVSAGSKWTQGSAYDPASVLRFASVYSLLANGMYNTSYALDYGFNGLGDGMVTYWSEEEWSSGITTSVVWTGGYMVPGTELTFNTAAVVTADQENGMVYLSTDGKDTVVFSDFGGTVSSQDGTVLRTVVPGKNTVSGLADGFYRLSQGTWAGQFLPYAVTADTQDHAAVAGGAAICNGSETVFVTVNDGELTILSSGTQYRSSDLMYRFTSSGKVFDASVADAVKSFSKQTDMMFECITKAAVAGQVMWTLSARAGSANMLLSPSSISPDLTDMGFDAEQSYALYVSALSQISSYYASYGEILNAGQVKISAESLKMYCFGSVYSKDGTAIAENVVFTPIVNLHNMTVTRGAVNTFGETGMIMIWSSSVGSLDEFTQSDERTHTVAIMPEGSYFVPSEMKYGGEDVQTVKLTVREISRTEGLEKLVRDTVSQPKQIDANSIMAVVLIELACILALVGYAFRIPVMFAVSAVIAAIGLFVPGVVVKLILRIMGAF